MLIVTKQLRRSKGEGINGLQLAAGLIWSGQFSGQVRIQGKALVGREEWAGFSQKVNCPTRAWDMGKSALCVGV